MAPPRNSRHGRVVVGYPPRNFDDQRPSPYVRPVYETVVQERQVRMVNGEVVIVPACEVPVCVGERPMTLDEVQASRAQVLRASGPTTQFGDENKPEHMASRGKPSSAPSKGKVR